MKIHAASAVAPVTTHKRALSYLAEGLEDDVLGPISMEHVQLCPQHAGYIDEALLEQLMELYPATKFRLHASPKLLVATSLGAAAPLARPFRWSLLAQGGFDPHLGA